VEGGTQERSDGATAARRERDYWGDTWQDATGEGGGRIYVMDTWQQGKGGWENDMTEERAHTG
jgi:hypothetical protein